jgi:hypothetical protein
LGWAERQGFGLLLDQRVELRGHLLLVRAKGNERVLRIPVPEEERTYQQIVRGLQEILLV